MTKHIIRFLLVGLHLTYSYAGVKVFDIEIGKTNVIELWKKNYIATDVAPHPHLKGYYRHIYRLPKKVNGGNQILITSRVDGIIQSISIMVDRKNIKKVFNEISKKYPLKVKTDTGPFGSYLFEKGDSTIIVSDLGSLPFLYINYYDTVFAKAEMENNKP